MITPEKTDSDTNSLNIIWFGIIVTSLGTVLSSISTFLQIGVQFPDQGLLEWSLALKTFGGALSAAFLAPFFKKMSIRKLVLFSQYWGILNTLGLLFSFKFGSVAGILFFVVTSAFPSILLLSSIRVLIKVLFPNEKELRSHQATLGILPGSCFLLGAMLAPTAVFHLGISGVLLIDVVTFFLASILLWFIKFHDETSTEALEGNSNAGIKKDFALLPRFVSGASIPLVLGFFALKGLPPMLASFSSHDFLSAWSMPMRANIWIADSMGDLFAGLFYKYNKAIQKVNLLLYLGIWSPLVLLLPLLFPNSFAIFWLTIFFFVFLNFLGFSKFRDDLLLLAKDKSEAVKAVSFINFWTQLTMAISPFLISLLLRVFTGRFQFVGALVVLQIVFPVLFLLFKPKKHQRVSESP